MEKPNGYSVLATCGRVQHIILSGMTHEEAIKFCDAENWEWNYNEGLIWDLEVIEDEFAFDGYR